MWLDRAEHIRAPLDGAGELDRAARRDRRHIPRRAILATLVFAGLRIGELLDLRWRDVDLTAGLITVRASRRTPACGKSTCCRRSVTSWSISKRPLVARIRTISCSAPATRTGRARPTWADAFSLLPSSGQTSG
jgi:integrase